MHFKRFSPRQLQVLNWWCRGSPHQNREGVICDGAVRSGKTLCETVSFIAWAFYAFEGQTFALCGKTIASLRRNVTGPVLPVLEQLGFRCRERVSHNRIDIAFGGRKNRFYLFGGRDEGSAALIQGITLAGVLLDEVALMPRSFVEQALARCSVSGSKFWFNCNPEHPFHWFYREWILGSREKNMLYLHFTMEDNPALSPQVAARYKKLYTGPFYRRYVLGEWVAAQGAVYPMFDPARHVVSCAPPCDRYCISCDYGTVNPASFGLWGHAGGIWYRLREYYHDSRAAGVQKTDEQYCDALEELARGLKIERVVVDPSAASFIQALRRRGKFRVVPAENQVLPGIARVGEALRGGKLLFHESCADCIREFSLYRWDTTSGQDKPVKEHDHAMDDIRYFVTTCMEREQGGFCARAARRRSDNRA
ncbi:PBSX family phage terminase large subunit [Oscillospiraceae bacterium MB08-C2-2]|nr:PBSX family phage terminase large subunit [Oscillospiraceae bacterium MB08-C2-2]